MGSGQRTYAVSFRDVLVAGGFVGPQRIPDIHSIADVVSVSSRWDSEERIVARVLTSTYFLQPHSEEGNIGYMRRLVLFQPQASEKPFISFTRNLRGTKGTTFTLVTMYIKLQ